MEPGGGEPRVSRSEARDRLAEELLKLLIAHRFVSDLLILTPSLVVEPAHIDIVGKHA